MSETPSKEDELAGTEQPFVQHLMELRDRMVKAIIAIAIAAAILFFFPGPGALYDFLAAPLVAHLPKGATLIATSVTLKQVHTVLPRDCTATGALALGTSSRRP